MRRAATLACLLIPLCLAACNRDAPPTDAVPTPDAAPAPWANDPSALRIETDVRKLADDAMEGRETGTRGYRMASAYVAERFAGIGLQERQRTRLNSSPQCATRMPSSASHKKL